MALITASQIFRGSCGVSSIHNERRRFQGGRETPGFHNFHLLMLEFCYPGKNGGCPLTLSGRDVKPGGVDQVLCYCLKDTE